MRKFLFGVREVVWWFVAELEDQLYPYRDREITEPMWAEKEVNIDELSYLRSQFEADQQRIERLQSEMIHVLRRIGELDDRVKSINTQLDIKEPDYHLIYEGQESSKETTKTSKETP